MAKIKNIVNCILEKPRPLTKYKGIEIKSPIIHKNQFSIFLFAIIHIATKNTAVVNESINAIVDKNTFPIR